MRQLGRVHRVAIAVLHERLGDGPTHVFCAHIIMVHTQRAVYASQRPISVQRHGFSVVFLGTHFDVSEVKAGWVEYQRSARYLKFRFWSDQGKCTRVTVWADERRVNGFDDPLFKEITAKRMEV